jgi:hypothetical protein
VQKYLGNQAKVMRMRASRSGKSLKAYVSGPLVARNFVLRSQGGKLTAEPEPLPFTPAQAKRIIEKTVKANLLRAIPIGRRGSATLVLAERAGGILSLMRIGKKPGDVTTESLWLSSVIENHLAAELGPIADVGSLRIVNSKSESLTVQAAVEVERRAGMNYVTEVRLNLVSGEVKVVGPRPRES